MSRGITINGVLFNGDIDEVEWEVTDVTGMGDPASSATGEQLVAQDGAWATTGYRQARTIGMQGVIRAVDAARLEQASDLFRNLISLEVFPVTFHYLAGDRTVWVRRDGEVSFDSRELPTEQRWSIVLKADDPAIYAGDATGSANITATTGLPHNDGGTPFPWTFPVTLSGLSSTGDVVLNLAAGGKVSFRIDGLCSQPQIVVENSEGLFRLAWFSILDAGMWLTVDPGRKQAKLLGQASRTPDVRLWPRMAAGQNIVRFRAAEYSSSALLTVTVRPTL